MQRLRELPAGGALRTFLLIARREFVTRVRSRFFLIGTAVLMILLAGYIVVQDRVISRAVTTVRIGFSGDAATLAQPLVAAAAAERGIKIEVTSLPDRQTGENRVRSGALDAAVSGDATAPDVVVKDSLDPTAEATLDALVKQVTLTRALTASGVDPSTVESKVSRAGVHLVLLDPNATQRAERSVVGVFVAVLLYVALLGYGQMVAAGVVEEKANRIIEILLSTVRPRQLLFGKVAGIGLMGFVQLLLVGIVAIFMVTRTQVIDVPQVSVVAVAGGLLWFVLGFVFYALIYAAGGSMVSRQEDLGAVVMPIAVLIVGTYLAFFWVLANPDQPAGIALSIIPPFAPILMPARMATGDASAWQVVLAVALMLGAIAAMNALAARIYSYSVLRVGTRVGFAQAWKGAD